MSDIQDPYVAPTEPAGAAADASPAAPAATDTPDYSAHPAWSKALEAVPEMLRGPIYEQIRTSENESRRAIETARGTDIPQDWRSFAAEAAEAGVTVEELAEAYRGQVALAELLTTDPDAFVSELQTQVDHLVATGQITRRQGADAMRQANAAAAEQTDDLLTPEQRELKELKAWQQEQVAEQQRAAQAERQRQAEAAHEQQLEAQADAYFDAFDTQMEQLGFAQRDAAGQLKSVIPIETFSWIGKVGGELLDANPRMKPEQAVSQAVAQVRRQIEATGGKLQGRAAQQSGVPVIGATSALPGTTTAPSGPRSMDDRANAALAEALRLAGTGD